MKGSVSFLKDQLVGSSHDDTNGATLIIDSRELDEF